MGEKSVIHLYFVSQSFLELHCAGPVVMDTLLRVAFPAGSLIVASLLHGEDLAHSCAS